MPAVRQTETFSKWFEKLRDQRAKARIAARIRRIEVTGNFGDVKNLKDKVSELRVDYGPGYRVYFTDRGEEIVILLCGGDKDTQGKDIETAKALAKGLEE
ncbi:type II toxin-antitoxin system RelE/ParE family toxin [Hansschlegelia zhihuaiae]|uniref:Type II toxin-antitoxin system RelE/ParE family toxin n=1 Tax=Hansschlegelia zhihuaiae TaxID=405005 RepID=A0A4Q0M442_9HYPH|nr:type II toxin-antitoxin system RelE/ParE family toxin [Hansschlegelia zhihuaiae]RXF67701.1 type II toxin-antitoxin system RelE/ParE family toxin [Hansschlegelia zhihuaiae]